jgi:CDP-glycerol glycerophosphotransferase
MADATGEYLLFVDSDDLMVPGSLKAISARIDQTDRPDIVIFDYARQYWFGTVRNQLADLLGAKGPAVFTTAERPELLELLMVVWNKAYRTDFVRAGGFHFPSGYYEDTPWTYPTMLAAETISILDRVCILYRQRRQGNILRSRNRKHFDIFDQWDRVYAFIDANPHLQHWLPFLMRREVEHVVTILGSNRRLTRADQRDFFHAAHEHFELHKPAEPVERPPGVAGLLAAFVMRDAYRRYRALERFMQILARLVTVGQGVQRRVTRIGGKVLRKLKRQYYRLHYHLPLDEHLAVYASYWYRGISCNPAAIYWKAKELAPEVRGVWVIRDPETAQIPEGVPWVRPDTLAYYRLLARAKFLVNNANFPDVVRRRKGAIHLQTQHGTPLKKMGLDLQDYPVGANRMSFARLLKRIDRWHFNLSMNRFSTLVWERSYPADYEMLEVGYPRNDRLVNAADEDVEALRVRLGIPASKRVVLYAPTFRDYQRKFTPEVDLVALLEAIGDDAVLLMRCHYFNDEEGGDALGGLAASRRLIDVSAHPSVEDLCLVSDALLTDYSSIMFDYALLDRPIAIYAYDWDTYVRCRGVNFDLIEEPPGVVATTAEELLESFRSGAVWGEQAAKTRAEFRRRFCEFDDGRASERVVRRVFLGEKLPKRMEKAPTAVTTSEHNEVSKGDEPEPTAPAEPDGGSGESDR